MAKRKLYVEVSIEQHGPRKNRAVCATAKLKSGNKTYSIDRADPAFITVAREIGVTRAEAAWRRTFGPNSEAQACGHSVKDVVTRSIEALAKKLRSRSSHVLAIGPVIGVAAVASAIYFVGKAFLGEVMPRSTSPSLPATRKEFAQAVMAALSRVIPNAPSATRILITAHAAFETGWGRTSGFVKGNNLFNITRLPTDPAPIIMGPDSECPPGTTDLSQCRKITQRFAAYPSIDASISHYLSFINRTKFGDAYSRLMAGRVDFVGPLGKGGYYTLPIPTYLSTIKSVFNQVTALIGVSTS